MTTWVIRSQTSGLKRAREIYEYQQDRGYEVWVEDENGRRIDEQYLKDEYTRRSILQLWIEPLFLLGGITLASLVFI
jgi:hypothetical protein